MLAAFSPVLALARVQYAPNLRQGASTSNNWSGYAVTTSKGSVTDVKGSWTVPTVTGTTSAYSSFWVGIDGYSSNTVEQIGTDSDIANGKATYYAWYEFYPKASCNIPITINPSDTISAEVKYVNGGKYTATITDTSAGKSFSVTAKVPSAAQSSAEWIVEAPWSGGVLPLANFGTASFSSCTATISGQTGSIGLFGNSVQSITMVTKTGTPKDQISTTVSATNPNGFSMTWLNSGP